MPTLIRVARVFVLPVLMLVLSQTNPVAAQESAAIKKLFANPTRDYATAPLWVWNDMLTEKQIRETMRDLAGQQVKQVFVHPRPGLMTPYLSKDWFRLWKVALKEAERLDMNVWIYDENSYPSGFAGGWVPEVMPESRGRGLDLREAKKPPQWTGDLVAIYQLSGNEGCADVSERIRAGEKLPEGRYVTAKLLRAGNSPWHGNRCYVDLLYPGVTEKFLDITLEPYRREIGEHFGKRVPGVFTDEPNIRPAGGLPWTEDLPKQFQARRGYNLMEHLPSLALPVGDWRKVRYDYFRVLNELFIERWAKPYYEYCEKNNLEFTGHYWDHEWPNCMGVPDNMAMYAWHQRPSIDCLMNQYAENTHAQFGNARMVKELSSVANQFNRARTLCELYGAGGWDLRFEDMKRIGDWLQVLGVNTLDEHLSYITLRGARKRDHPQSFSYHEPWWNAYHVMATYLTRVSVALSQGRQVNRVLMLQPTTTAWMYQNNGGRLQVLSDQFTKLLMAMEGAQVEYDLGCEDIIHRHGKVEGKAFIVAKRSYHTVVIPPATGNLNGKTLELLERFLEGGGRVLCAGEPPTRVEGSRTERVAALANHKGWNPVEPAALPGLLQPALDRDGLRITRQTNDAGILFHHRREIADGELLFLVNTSIEFPSLGVLETTARSIELWDLDTGAAKPYAWRATRKGTQAEFRLPPSGSLLLFLGKGSSPPAEPRIEQATLLSAAGPTEIARLEPNVLTLDYVTITAGGTTRTNVYFYQASQFAFQKNGMARNPWDSAVQFRNELITNRFPANSGFEASYTFTVAEKVPANLAIVIERPDFYTITCNGKTVRAKKGSWWLDKAFGRIEIARTARVGTNTVTLKARPFTIYHELEPAYVLGDFTLKPTVHGFVIAPDQPLRVLGQVQSASSELASHHRTARHLVDRTGLTDARIGWNNQGHPFYSAGVAYRQEFYIGEPSHQYVVAVPNWYGSVARVSVNGKVSGYLTAPPWQCAVTGQVRAGTNEIEVVVVGTLKNTLGPHHGRPGLGTAWPSMFHQGPQAGPPAGTDYHTVGYGLFEPFQLKHVVSRPVLTTTDVQVGFNKSSSPTSN